MLRIVCYSVYASCLMPALCMCEQRHYLAGSQCPYAGISCSGLTVDALELNSNLFLFLSSMRTQPALPHSQAKIEQQWRLVRCPCTRIQIDASVVQHDFVLAPPCWSFSMTRRSHAHCLCSGASCNSLGFLRLIPQNIGQIIFASLVGRSHQRSCCRVQEAHALGLTLVCSKGLWRDIL